MPQATAGQSEHPAYKRPLSELLQHDINVRDNASVLVNLDGESSLLSTISSINAAAQKPIHSRSRSNVQPQDISYWTEADEIMLHKSNEDDLRLWRYTNRYLKCTPPDMLPKGAWVDVKRNYTYRGQRQGYGIFCDNWGSMITKSVSICCTFLRW